MPELPEVETMCRGIRPVIGARIQRVVWAKCRLRPITLEPKLATFRRRVTARVITGIERLGKRAILRLDHQDRLVIEPRMTGLLLIADPPNQTHLRLGLELRGVDVDMLWFWDRRGLGVVKLLSEAEFTRQLASGRLGPDALQITPLQLRTQLSSSRRPIKVALMDQRLLAGVGNLYASEILHVAGIHPAMACHHLSHVQWQRLHQALRQVLTTAIRYEGSTLNDGTFRNALNRDGSYQNHHRVYMKAGQHCGNCEHGVVQRVVQAQRSTFFCPRCQRKVNKRSA